MKYQLLYTKRAVKDIKSLDTVTKKRLRKALERFIGNPLFYSEKLHNSKLGQYRFRVGNYRIIFDLDKNKVVVLRVGHRREIYR